MLVWLEQEGQRCDRCGTYTWQWQTYDEDTDTWEMLPHVHQEADLWTCHGCREIDDKYDKVRDSDGAIRNGLQVRWFPKLARRG